MEILHRKDSAEGFRGGLSGQQENIQGVDTGDPVTFGQICSQNRRMVVVHHTHLIPNIVNLLKHGDLVFFDDCLYSQYVFLRGNSDALDKLGIIRVLGLSPKAIRPYETDGIYEVESSVLHNQLNEQVRVISNETNGDYIRGFMSMPEVKTLLTNKNTFLALHGCCHLDMTKVPKF